MGEEVEMVVPVLLSVLLSVPVLLSVSVSVPSHGEGVVLSCDSATVVQYSMIVQIVTKWMFENLLGFSM